MGTHTMHTAAGAANWHLAIAATKKITLTGLDSSAMGVWTGFGRTRSAGGSTACLKQRNGSSCGGYGARARSSINLSTYTSNRQCRDAYCGNSCRLLAPSKQPSATRCQRMPAPLLQQGETHLRPQLRMQPLRPPMIPAVASERDGPDLPARCDRARTARVAGLYIIYIIHI